MAAALLRSRTALILPLVFLVVALLEEVAAYKVRQLVSDVHAQTAIIVALYGIGFTLASAKLIPFLRSLLVKVRRDTRRDAGVIGLAVFYGLAYGLIFYAFLVIETRGPAGLLPPELR